jgi:hypothetical protein
MSLDARLARARVEKIMTHSFPLRTPQAAQNIFYIALGEY